MLLHVAIVCSFLLLHSMGAEMIICLHIVNENFGYFQIGATMENVLENTLMHVF